jgi:hypothetical protein
MSREAALEMRLERVEAEADRLRASLADREREVEALKIGLREIIASQSDSVGMRALARAALARASRVEEE